MDANGARALKARIEAQHWRSAGAVRDGRQAADDPDAELVLECAEDLRTYVGGQQKRLVGDAWVPLALKRRDAAA
jgi:hypothetical protein